MDAMRGHVRVCSVSEFQASRLVRGSDICYGLVGLFPVLSLVS